MPPDSEEAMPEATMPSRKRADSASPLARVEGSDAPWPIQQLWRGDGDLHTELAARYPNQPLLSLFSTRVLNERPRRELAALMAQDGAAHLLFEIDSGAHQMQVVYTLASMLSLRFDLSMLTDRDRAQWLEQVMRGGSRVTVLWGAKRWKQDYMIWSQRPYFTNVYAFSAHHVEAAARLTHDAAAELLRWLGRVWQPETAAPEPPPSPDVSW